MSVLLFRLRNVPEDEAEDVRELLNKNGFEFYENNGLPGNCRFARLIRIYCPAFQTIWSD